VKVFGRDMTPQGATETVLDIIYADPSHGGTMSVFHSMSEDDVEYILKYPTTCVASDGWQISLDAGYTHPRLYGTFPRVLGRYVRENNLISFEDAIRKMTMLPAQRLSLNDRGLIRQDAWADIVIWDRTTVNDKATFENPHQYPSGIDYVIVNGEITLEKGNVVGNYSGVFLRRNDK